MNQKKPFFPRKKSPLHSDELLVKTHPNSWKTGSFLIYFSQRNKICFPVLAKPLPGLCVAKKDAAPLMFPFSASLSVG